MMKIKKEIIDNGYEEMVSNIKKEVTDKSFQDVKPTDINGNIVRVEIKREMKEERTDPTPGCSGFENPSGYVKNESREQSGRRSRCKRGRNSPGSCSWSRSRIHKRRRISYSNECATFSQSSTQSRSRARNSWSRTPRPRHKYPLQCRRDNYCIPTYNPVNGRKRHVPSRVNPQPNRCLGVFGLSLHTTEAELHHIMSKYGPLESIHIVTDFRTGRSRGFSFVKFVRLEDAMYAKERCSGMDIDGKRIRIEFSITERSYSPTPGIYMGQHMNDYHVNSQNQSPTVYCNHNQYSSNNSELTHIQIVIKHQRDGYHI